MCVTNPGPETLRDIHALKRQPVLPTLGLAAARPHEQSRGPMGSFAGLHQSLFRDVYDHIIQIGDTVETLREMVSSMMEVYLSSVSYRLNGVMKVLTIITTIFMPLSFIASIYGMNFEHMPELKSPWGYPAVLASWP